MIAYCEVSAFTDTPGQGNRAGVVLEANALSDSEMQAMAFFIDASETVFVTHQGPGWVKVRYFTPTQEVEFCGHATLALGLVLAQAGRWCKRLLEVHTQVGTIEIELEESCGAPQRIWMTQHPPEVRPVPTSLRRELAEALGIDHRMIHRGLPLASCSTGLWSVFVPILDPVILDGLEPDQQRISNLTKALDALGLYAYSPMGPNRFAARDFAPRLGIHEDPVTGSSAGALISLLATEGRLPVHGEQARGLVYQGHCLDTPGEVEVIVSLEGQNVRNVRVGGHATMYQEGYWEEKGARR